MPIRKRYSTPSSLSSLTCLTACGVALFCAVVALALPWWHAATFSFWFLVVGFFSSLFGLLSGMLAARRLLGKKSFWLRTFSVCCSALLGGLLLLFFLESNNPHPSPNEIPTVLRAAKVEAHMLYAQELPELPSPSSWRLDKKAYPLQGGYEVDFSCGCGPKACMATVTSSPKGALEDVYNENTVFSTRFTVCE